MIKKFVVCDRCQKEMTSIIIPCSRTLPKDTVLCDKCAKHYYELNESPLRCAQCGISLDEYAIRCDARPTELYCSVICAIKDIEPSPTITGTHPAHNISENEIEELIDVDNALGGKKPCSTH